MATPGTGGGPGPVARAASPARPAPRAATPAPPARAARAIGAAMRVAIQVDRQAATRLPAQAAAPAPAARRGPPARPEAAASRGPADEAGTTGSGGVAGAATGGAGSGGSAGGRGGTGGAAGRGGTGAGRNRAEAAAARAARRIHGRSRRRGGRRDRRLRWWRRGERAAMLGATPPMGWNSWNTVPVQHQRKPHQGDRRRDGLERNERRRLPVRQPRRLLDGRTRRQRQAALEHQQVPGGIPALADYVHGKGLKIGIYEVPGTTTCVGIYGGISPSVAVGSLGHETTDAQTFASWGIDYLKYDKCTNALSGFAVMRDALRATGRPIFYSINPGDGNGCARRTAARSTCRRSPTCGASASTSTPAGRRSSGSSIRTRDLYSYAGPGHWNDPDMLEVGNSGINDTEGRAHFSMWAIMAAPLIAGNDLRSMSAATRTTLTNSEVIAVDQDPMGVKADGSRPPPRTSRCGRRRCRARTRGRWRSSIVARRPRPSPPSGARSAFPTGAATVRDLWSHTDLGTFSGSYTASSVPSHGVVMLKVTSAP